MMNTKLKVIGLTRLGIKPKSTAIEADVFTTPPAKLLKNVYGLKTSRRKHGFCCR